jgi:uncharacterized protein (DUF302 family)
MLPFSGFATPIKPHITATSWVYSLAGEFADVKDDLVRAIETQGAVVSYVAHADKMLKRTAAAVKVKNTVYQNAEVVLFCKAEIAHQVLQADPHAITLCPYPIAIYTLTGKPGRVFLSINKPPKDLTSYQPVLAILLAVIDNVITF